MSCNLQHPAFHESLEQCREQLTTSSYTDQQTTLNGLGACLAEQVVVGVPVQGGLSPSAAEPNRALVQPLGDPWKWGCRGKGLGQIRQHLTHVPLR